MSSEKQNPTEPTTPFVSRLPNSRGSLNGAALLFVGLRRAFAPDRRLLSKIVALTLTTFSALIFAMFIFVAFVAARWLPPSTGAPQVNQKAPGFELIDTNNKPVSLTGLLLQPINSKPAKGVLLIFYRGYW